MAGLYRRAIHRWELRLATRDRNRVVKPFEWGLEWLNGSPHGGDPARQLLAHTQAALADSDRYFSYRTPDIYQFRSGWLSFESPLQTPHRENNTAYARFLPAPGSRRAVILLPQWNADRQGHIGLGRMLNWFGISALRLTLPYHDQRRPVGLERADYHVSSNVGRTIHACRQAVIDTRACLDWLENQGYEALGVLGTSLGSCISLLVAAHDRRLRAGVFNHISTYFSDVVWTGLSTRHVREGLEPHLTLAQLRDCWRVISPASYLDRLEGRDFRSLLVWGRHDLSFLPKYSRQVLAQYRRRGLPHRTLALPCGHYTLGQAPFKYIDGLSMSWFLHRNLRDEDPPPSKPRRAS
jgi:hypothetical protein